jgi:hypothetical protein
MYIDLEPNLSQSLYACSEWFVPSLQVEDLSQNQIADISLKVN